MNAEKIPDRNLMSQINWQLCEAEKETKYLINNLRGLCAMIKEMTRRLQDKSNEPKK